MPITIQVTGLASNAVLTNQIAPCHSNIAPLTRPIQATISTRPATKPITITVWYRNIAILRRPAMVRTFHTVTKPSQTIFDMPTVKVSRDMAAMIPNTTNVAMPITRVMLGNNWVQRVSVLAMPTKRSISGARIGINDWPKAMRSACTAAPNCCHGSTMALAMRSAFSRPRTLPSCSMPFFNRPVSPIRVVIRRAASPPKASRSCLPLASIDRSPNLPLSLSRMFIIGSNLPCWSTKDIPSFSDAPLTFSKNDL